MLVIKDGGTETGRVIIAEIPAAYKRLVQNILSIYRDPQYISVDELIAINYIKAARNAVYSYRGMMSQHQCLINYDMIY